MTTPPPEPESAAEPARSRSAAPGEADADQAAVVPSSADVPIRVAGDPGGDRGGVDAFIRDEYAGLFAWLWSRTGSADRAADLTQAAFAAWWASTRKRPVRHPRSWLYRIAGNEWRRMCRDAAVARRHAPDLPEPGIDAPDGPEEEESRQLLRREVARLPADLRDPLVLRYWSGLAHREIGRVLGIPTSLVRWRVYRAIRRLGTRLPDERTRNEPLEAPR